METSILSPDYSSFDGRVYVVTSSNLVASSGPPDESSTVSSSISIHTYLPPGTYTLLAATRHAAQESAFGITVESTQPVSMQQLWPPRRPFGADDKLAKAAMMGSAADGLGTALVGLLGRVLVESVQGGAQVRAAKKLAALKAREEEKRKATRERLAKRLVVAGMDSALTSAQRLERVFGAMVSTSLEMRIAIGRRLIAWGGPLGGLLGAFLQPFRMPDGLHPNTHTTLLSLARQEREGVKGILFLYSTVRAACLFSIARDAVSVLPPIVTKPGANKSPAQIKVEEGIMARASLERVAGTASDPEVALQLQCLDLDLFRFSDEERRGIPGLEIVDSIPLDFDALSAPLEDEDTAASLEAQIASDRSAIAAIFEKAKAEDAEMQAFADAYAVERKKKEDEDKSLLHSSASVSQEGGSGDSEDGDKGTYYIEDVSDDNDDDSDTSDESE